MTELKPFKDALLMGLVQAVRKTLDDAKLLDMEVEISASKLQDRWGVQLTMTEVEHDDSKM